MKILFVVADLYIGEPIGVLLLSAILEKNGHRTRLIGLKTHDIRKTLLHFDPDVIAYSASSPDIELLKKADLAVREWARNRSGAVLRIMGGPHPTYSPEVLDEMSLDAICRGDGDRAIVEMTARFESGENLSGIPNVVTPGEDPDGIRKELFENLDELPFLNRAVFYEAAPYMQDFGLRSFMCSRGCPYDCAYCFNHAYKKLFRDCGRLMRRHSVDYVISEIRHVAENYPRLTLVKFTDDTFAHQVDDWLTEFLDRYKKEIGLPFYCLMRPNTLTEEMARLLSSAGCISMCMAIETGSEKIRNDILKRNLSDRVIIEAFRFAKKYNIKTWGNTLLAIPGTTFEDDFNSFLFVKKLDITVPTFCPFYPYPKLALTEYAKELGILEKDYDSSHKIGFMTPLDSYTEKEKKMQLNLSYLASIFCLLPDFFIPLLKTLIRINAHLLYRYLGATIMIFRVTMNIFPGTYPLNPLKLLKLFFHSLRIWAPGKNINELPGG
jgi:radical SAM superfamily enzyme YgiQ (UPF0313 family)